MTGRNFCGWDTSKCTLQGLSDWRQNLGPMEPISTVSSKIRIIFGHPGEFFISRKQNQKGCRSEPSSPHPNQQPCGGDSELLSSPVKRQHRAENRNQLRQRGRAEACSLLRTPRASLISLPFCLVSKSLQRDCTTFLCQEDVVCIFLYNVASDLLGHSPYPEKYINKPQSLRQSCFKSHLLLYWT